MLKLTHFTVNSLYENTYLAWCSETLEAVIIDPGCYDHSEQERIYTFVEENSLKPVAVWLTHGHFDHVLGVQAVTAKYNIPLYQYEGDYATYKSVESYVSNYGYFQYSHVEPEAYFKDGDMVPLGKCEIKVLFTPGHAPGHVCYYNEPGKILVGGDVLFYQSVGRTDLAGGDWDTLVHSIETVIFPLGDDVVVFPGHGPSTSVGFEKKHNPFLGKA